MTARSLSLQTARQLHLAAQGLLRPPARKARYEDVMSCIRQMSLLQIDTINVVARSPWLVLFSRLGAFDSLWLEQLLARGDIFEYWAHEACFIPREDFPLLRHRMLSPEKLGWKYSAGWMAEHQAEVDQLLEHIRQTGPVRAADFTADAGHKPGWWAWKPYKRHLENLFSAGELMVTARHNFQRVYDLRQRVMPEWDDKRDGISDLLATEQMLLNSARSLGVFKASWLPDYYRLKQIKLPPLLARWQEQGHIVSVSIEQLGDAWLHTSLLPLTDKLPDATHSALLSQFDPVVWDRRRAGELFGFDYRLECYTPEAKRQYGYFVLPVLHKGQLKGRLDAKLHRARQTLEIKGLWLEPHCKVTQGFISDIHRLLRRFAGWQQAQQVMLNNLPAELYRAWGRGFPV